MCEHLTKVESHSNRVTFFNVKTNQELKPVHLITSAVLVTMREKENVNMSEHEGQQ
jgi:hypothetical protein